MRPAAAVPADPPPRLHHRQASERDHPPWPGTPHGRSVPPHQQTTSPDLSRASTDSSEPRTVITVVPPAPLGRPSRHQAKDLGRAVAFADMPKVAPSTSPRSSHSATSATTTPSVTGTRCYVDVLRGGGQPSLPGRPGRPGRRLGMPGDRSGCPGRLAGGARAPSGTTPRPLFCPWRHQCRACRWPAHASVPAVRGGHTAALACPAKPWPATFSWASPGSSGSGLAASAPAHP
jgi:hypothetical protein